MHSTDPIADMLTRIRNAAMVRKSEVRIPHSKVKLAIARILSSEGYLGAVEETAEESLRWISIALKYSNGEPVIRGIKRISKPGHRVYHGYQKLPVWTPELGVAILSTSQGIMTHRQAKKKKIGGEVLCEVY